MATQTANYGFTKPGVDDPIDIADLNKNFDDIDTEIKNAADAIPPVATPQVAGIVKPDGVTIMVDKDGTIRGAQTYVLPTATPTTLGGIKVGENLTITEEGKLNAYANVVKDAAPTQGSENVPTSGGTYAMINEVGTQVNGLSAQVTALTTGIAWKDAVSTFDDIATTYAEPEIGWTVMCLDTGYAYQWNGTAWGFIMASLVAVATVADVQAVLNA